MFVEQRVRWRTLPGHGGLLRRPKPLRARVGGVSIMSARSKRYRYPTLLRLTDGSHACEENDGTAAI
jgi:hypothetical protein